MTVASDPLARLPSGDIGPAAVIAHPLAQVRQAAVDDARAQEDVLARTDFPRVLLQSSVFARGSGASPDGGFDGGADGLGLDRANWAAGVQVVFPNVFDFSSLRARKAAAAASSRANAALYDEAVLTITSQQQAAAAMLQTTRAVAANTPVQLAAAQQSESAGPRALSSRSREIVEVADAQSLLAQAEVQDQLARVDVWRALLAEAVAQGDLAPLLAIHRQPREPAAMWLIRAALRRPITVLVAVIAVALTAFFAVSRMRSDIFPDLDLPVIYVAQPYGGMSPAQMEGYIIYYYEYHFLYINGIESVESKSIQNTGLLKLTFHAGTDMAQALAQTIGYVNRARAFMPPGTVGPFIMRFDAGTVPVGYLVFSSETRSLGEIQDLALNRVRPQFATLDWLTSPPPFGGSQRTIVIRVDPDRLRSYGMAADEVDPRRHHRQRHHPVGQHQRRRPDAHLADQLGRGEHRRSADIADSHRRRPDRAFSATSASSATAPTFRRRTPSSTAAAPSTSR